MSIFLFLKIKICFRRTHIDASFTRRPVVSPTNAQTARPSNVPVYQTRFTTPPTPPQQVEKHLFNVLEQGTNTSYLAKNTIK